MIFLCRTKGYLYEIYFCHWLLSGYPSEGRVPHISLGFSRDVGYHRG